MCMQQTMSNKRLQVLTRKQGFAPQRVPPKNNNPTFLDGIDNPALLKPTVSDMLDQEHSLQFSCYPPASSTENERRKSNQTKF